MPKITKFDRSTCRTVQEAAKEALEKVAAEFGLTLQPAAGRFDATKFTAKFEFVAVGEGGIPADFEKLCGLFGLDKDDFGKEFVRVNGDRVKITGLSPSRRKYPIVVEILRTGKTILITEYEVTRCLNKPNPSPRLPSPFRRDVEGG